MTPEELSHRLSPFAARVAKVVNALPDTRVRRPVAGRIVRGGKSDNQQQISNDQFPIEPVIPKTCRPTGATQKSGRRSAGRRLAGFLPLLRTTNEAACARRVRQGCSPDFSLQKLILQPVPCQRVAQTDMLVPLVLFVP